MRLSIYKCYQLTSYLTMRYTNLRFIIIIIIAHRVQDMADYWFGMKTLNL